MTLLSSLGIYFSHKFHLSGAQAGNLSASFFYGNILLQIPSGFIVDRFSHRKLLLISGAVFILFAFMLALTNNFSVLIISRFIMGTASAVSFLAVIKTVVDWTPPAKLGTMLGLVITQGMCGGIIQTPFSIFYVLYGGETTLLINAYIACAILFLGFIFIKEKIYTEAIPKINFKEAFIDIAHRGTFLPAIYIFIMDILPIVFGAMWGTLFLQAIYKLNLVHASIIVSFIFIGKIPGSFLIGYLSDKFKTRKGIMLICAIFSTLNITIIIYVTLPIMALYFLFFTAGLFSSGISAAFTIISESNKKNIGLANAVTSTVVMSTGVLLPILGILLDYFSPLVHGHLIHTASAYKTTMIFIPILFSLSIALNFFLRDNFEKIKRQE